MDTLFKRKLLNLRNPPIPQTFSQALMGEGFFSSHSPKNEKKSSEGFTEKRQVIESLERFAKEKIEDVQTPVIRFEGGEIAIKPDPVWDGVEKSKSLEELLNKLTLPPEILEILFKKKVPGKIKAFFVTENIRPWDEVKTDLRNGFVDELLTGFSPKTAEFFERMIMAMKLTAEEVLVYPIENLEETDLSSEVIEIALYMNPEIVITLGAKASQKILKSNDRLSLIHGQFHERKVGDETVLQIVPLYHPSILETNLSMKKTTWQDMQEIMRHLKKIP